MHVACKFKPTPRSQTGFTMIEAMVAIAILSFSLLGLALLQAQGLKLNSDAYSRTQASILAYDILDRMRINTVNLASYDTSSTTPTGTCNQTTVSATNDIVCWTERLAQTLGPDSSGSIIVVASTVPNATVTITWFERRLRADGTTGPVAIQRQAAWEADF